MIDALRIPVLTAIYSLIGVGLAALWYSGMREVALGLGVAALIVAVVLGVVADRLITSKPKISLFLYEYRALAIGILSAVASCFTVLITIYFTELAGSLDPQKTLLSTLSSSLTALIAGLFVSAKDTDEVLGKFIASKFQARFRAEGETLSEGQVALPPDSDALRAVFAAYSYGWTDWSRDIRHERIGYLHSFLNPSVDNTSPSVHA
ncbi:MAG: hypothetical protein QOF52_333 [Propionibacteriaceae bacterium]|jgi:hypothetical protein|nr:hypothetical protein [Propionibacteriaceae bacterium]MDX6320475.1 hypothetical protein [Propionibacteriaceae bacterium]